MRPSLDSLTGFGPPLLHEEVYLCWEGWGWNGPGYRASWAFRSKELSMDCPGLPAVFPPGESPHPQAETFQGVGPGLPNPTPGRSKRKASDWERPCLGDRMILLQESHRRQQDRLVTPLFLL